MPTRKITTVKGADVKPGQVVKIGGRWLRIVAWMDNGYPMRFATVAKHDHDPRMVTSTTGRWRIIHADDDYLTREQAAPVWDWVSRNVQRDEDLADGITTPCRVCATHARLKGATSRAAWAMWASRGLNWPVVTIDGWTVHKACTHDIEHLAGYVTDGTLAIDPATGVARWTTNGQAIPEDCAAMFAAFALAPGLDTAATAAAHDAETTAFLARYRASQPAQASAEEIADMRAAFGPGQVVVDVITGRTTQL
jgi:hypothetical protein